MRNDRQWFRGLIILVLCIQMVACGTILYPERKGQRSGRLDIGVVLLDGIGLLCFIIPGVIAYAVDFSNGTIYLPGTSAKKSGRDGGDLKTVRFDMRNATPDMLEKIIHDETGYDLDWQDERLRVIRLKSKEDIPVRFAQAAQTAPAGSRLVHSGKSEL